VENSQQFRRLVAETMETAAATKKIHHDPRRMRHVYDSIDARFRGRALVAGRTSAPVRMRSDRSNCQLAD
jgi:hypothetical protein